LTNAALRRILRRMPGEIRLVHHYVFLILLVLLPVSGVRGMRRMRARQPLPAPDPAPAPTPAHRRGPSALQAYGATMLFQIAVCWLVLYGGSYPAAWPELGLGPPRMGPLRWFVGACALLLPFFWQWRSRRLRNPVILARVRARYDKIKSFLPRNGRDYAAFVVLSLVGGVCEEILYRGFLGWYLVHVMSPLATAFVASLVFALGHVYQGWKNAARTFLFGLMHWFVYGLTGSIVPGMVLHALFNIQAGDVIRRAFAAGEPVPAAR
jgi:membrane protease YdiL (CAAX protease family)